MVGICLEELEYCIKLNVKKSQLMRIGHSFHTVCKMISVILVFKLTMLKNFNIWVVFLFLPNKSKLVCMKLESSSTNLSTLCIAKLQIH
jgi:hypothetical protein